MRFVAKIKERKKIRGADRSRYFFYAFNVCWTWVFEVAADILMGSELEQVGHK